MKYFYHKRQRRVNPRRGFTLVETLVAITILLVAIVGPMTIAARGLQGAFYAREPDTAFWLAQEGIELIREWRDENVLSGVNWLSGTNLCGGSQGCGLDARNTPRVHCSNPHIESTCRLKDEGAVSGSRGFYNYAGGTPTQFTRHIWVTPVSGAEDQEADVKVTVTWQSGLFATPKTVTVQSRIFNQYDNL